MAAVAVLGLTRGPALLHWLGIGLSRAASVSGQLRPSLIPYAVLGAAAVVLVIVMRRLGPRSRPRLLAGFVGQASLPTFLPDLPSLIENEDEHCHEDTRAGGDYSCCH